MTKANNIVSLDKARWSKEHDRKDEVIDEMAKRFEAALPSKPTPVKDFLKKKRAKKKR